MEFRVLGPLEVVGDDGRLPIGRGKRRTLLALLLLDANNVVSHDHLIDAIWGERPPATVRSALHVLVSELRAALGDAEVLVTQPAGYVLRIAAEELDSTRFEHLLAAGREALSTGNPQRAESILREALALWRGPPLQDFAYEDFAQVEIARLEELRLDAEEELLETELALGRGDVLVPRLETLIARNPGRERLRGQLMLALYRAQRQTEALEAYQAARRTLVEELGVEPSPALQRLQQAILQQDPTLEPPAAARALPPRLRRRGRKLLIAAAVPALAGLGIGLFFALHRGKAAEPPPLAAPPPRSVALIDPGANKLIAAIPLATRPLATDDNPEGIIVAYGSVWVTDGGQQTVLRIDPKTRRIVKTIGIGADVRTLAAGFGSIWVTGGSSATVTRIDPHSNRVTATIPLGSSHGTPNTAIAIAAGAGAVWTSAGADSVARIDPASNRVAQRIRVPAVFSLAADARHVWAGTWVSESAIFELSPDGSRRTFATLEPGNGAGALAVRGNALWVIVATGTTLLYRYDTATGKLEQTIDAGRTNSALTLTPDAVWIGELLDHDVVRLSTRSGKIVARIALSKSIVAISAGEGLVWAAVQS